MAIELTEDLKTVRTYPRLMKSKATGWVVLILHDRIGGLAWLSGPGAGKTTVDIDWSDLEDHPGSVTLWNRD